MRIRNESNNGKKIPVSSRDKLERLYYLYEQSMYRAAYAILNSVQQSEDAVSEAFIKIAGKIDSIDDPDSEKTRNYVKKIIKNISIDFYRKNKHESEKCQMSDSYEEISDNSAEAKLKKIESEDIIQNILGGLSDRYRKIFMMRCMDDMSFAEIAAVVKEKPATVRKKYERARKIIRKNIQDGEDYYEYKKKIL